ncbi:hypothetical protein ZIOFF_013434 [Zingiber officinale]|uniref:Uncharacterized protein n=1 Tax=Zingiber officinale TaxID=94328 RepID=A0A8J5LCS7_ZINOF|nr:hypothetical protein ZIOFF_013434 [Zingiber officinale]
METRDSFRRTLDFDSQDTTSPSSVEELASGNTSLSSDTLFDKEIMDFIPQFFENDSQSSAASDEQSIISRGNSFAAYSSKIQWAEWFGLRIPASVELIPPSTRLRHLQRKSQSLADMSQMMLSQANAGKTLCFTSLKG